MRPALDIDFDHADYKPCNAASSAEPMQRPDHKSKKHPRPRRNHKAAGGHVAFRRVPTDAETAREQRLYAV